MESAENRLPRLVEGIDVRRLPIGPEEAFVLSRIDGASNEGEIAASTGLSQSAVHATISRLLALGVVSIAAAPREAPRAPRHAMSSSPQLTVGAIEELVVHVEHPGASLYDGRELEEDVDIDLDRKRTILETFHRLERANHYELLGVAPHADKRAIRARYHEIINVYHPDRYYGKRLGSFKPKLERIFQRLTEAHDVLARSQSRSEYDAYLNLGDNVRKLEDRLNDEEAYARELDAVRARIEAEAGQNGTGAASSPVTSMRPPVPPPATPIGSSVRPTPPQASQVEIDRALRESQPDLGSNPFASPRALARTPSLAPPQPSRPAAPRSVMPVANSSIPSAAPATEPPQSSPRVDADLRRRALARKLGFSSPPPELRPSPPPIDASVARERATSDLKRRYEQRMAEARRGQITEYVERAEAALAGHKLVDAVNSLRIAVSLAPDDARLRQRLEDLQAEANKELADRYSEQAQYEERERHWPEAARSYARAVAGKPNPRLHERLAFCLLMAQGDVKQAVEHARKAVLQAPNEVRNRQTLAKAYIAANMRESALGELERAAALAPSDDTIRELLRRARRGEF